MVDLVSHSGPTPEPLRSFGERRVIDFFGSAEIHSSQIFVPECVCFAHVLLETENQEIRSIAARELALFGPELPLALRLAGAEVRESFLLALSQALLREGSPEIRRDLVCVVKGMGEFKGQFAPHLAFILSQPESGVVTEVVELLGSLGPKAKGLGSAVLHALEGENRAGLDEKWRAFCDAVGLELGLEPQRFGGMERRSRAAQMFSGVRLSDRLGPSLCLLEPTATPRERRGALDFLASQVQWFSKEETGQAVLVLSWALGREEVAGCGIKPEIIGCLAALGSAARDVVPLLSRMINAKEECAWMAAYAIDCIENGQLGDSSVRFLADRLHSRDWRVRAHAAFWLGRLVECEPSTQASADLVDRLVILLRDDEKFVRSEAVDSLRGAGRHADRLFPVLSRMLADEDEDWLTRVRICSVFEAWRDSMSEELLHRTAQVLLFAEGGGNPRVAEAAGKARIIIPSSPYSQE